MNARIASCVVMLALAGLASPAAAQTRGQLKLPDFASLAEKAAESVVVQIDPQLLGLACRFLDNSDPEEAAAQQMCQSLTGIYVRKFTFDDDYAYPKADIDAVRRQLAAPGWSKLVGATSKKEHSDVDVYLLVDKKRKDRWLESIGAGLGYEPTSIEFYRKGSGWHRIAPTAHLVSSGKETEKNRQRDVEEDYEVAAEHVTSMIGRAVLDRIRPGGHPAWLAEASGFLTEVKFNETANCCYVSETKYREEIAGKDGSKQKYFEFMKGQVASGLDRPLRQIFTLELNYLDWADTVKSWSFVEFLREKHPAQLKELMRRPFPEIDQITPEHVAAAIQAMKPKDPAAVKPGTQ